MRIVLQRVSRANVTVAGTSVASIGQGFVLLVGVAEGDSLDDAEIAIRKVSELRVFADREGRMNRSVEDIGGEILVVSQFTLLADVRKGRRPSFVAAAGPEEAEPLIDRICEGFAERGVPTAAGVFGAMMQVELVNDGPVSIVLDIVDGRIVQN